MRTAFLLALSLGILAPLPAPAAPAARLAQQDLPIPPGGRKATEAERKAVSAAIEGQLKAFKADDYAAAMKFQSETLKDNFETPDEFRRAMKQGYPQFARYKTITYGLATADTKGERVAIQVTLTGEDNVTVRGIYLMVKEKGEFKVDTVLGGTRPQPRTSPRDEV